MIQREHRGCLSWASNSSKNLWRICNSKNLSFLFVPKGLFTWSDQRAVFAAMNKLTSPDHPDKELLNNVVDRTARVTPDLVYAELPKSSTDLSLGFHQVTYRHFANSINGVAWWLRENLGLSKTFETLTYIGPNDLRYNLLLLGAVKAGYKVLAHAIHTTELM